MLSKQYRLQKEDNIPRVLKEGNSFQTSLFLAKYIQNQKKNSRFTIIVSQKVSKKGIKRNTLRRRLYEAIRLNLEKKDPKPYYDIVILPSRRGLDATYQDIEKNVLKLLGHLNE